MGIRNKLVLCLLAVLFPLAAVGMFATHLVDRQIAERSSATLATTQRLEAARLNQSKKAYADHARALASGIHIREFATQLHNVRFPSTTADAVTSENPDLIGGLNGFAIIDPNAPWPLQELALSLQRKAIMVGSSVTELRIVDRRGDVLGETMNFSWLPLDERLIERSMRTLQTYFGDAFVNPDDQQLLGMVSPIISANGSVVGALIMETRLNPLIDIISTHETEGESIEAHIAQRTIDGNAQFITALRFDQDAAFKRIVQAETGSPVIQALNSPTSQVITALDYRGVESLLAFQTIEGLGWALILKVDTAEIFAPAVKLRNWLWLATAASISFVALIYLFFLVPIVSRLNKAAVAARQITNGHLAFRIVDQSNDEISELAYSINVLARDLEVDQKMRCEVEAKLRHQAIHDELTGLLNRKHTNKVIKRLSDELGQEHSVLFLDLNGFKDVNDLYGHAAGDEVLVSVAQRLANQVSKGNTLARWGGDEFVVIMPNVSAKQAENIASDLRSVFDEPVDSSEGRHSISCSFGLATSSKSKTLKEALIDADALMYQQKKQQQFDRSKTAMVSRGLERAMLENRTEMWFEPIVRLEQPITYLLAGAQAHIRVSNKEGVYIVPEEYMGHIENFSVLRDLDLHAIKTALQTLRRWNTVNVVDNNFQLSIKLSTYTLNTPNFVQFLETQLQETGVPATQLQLELDQPISLSGVTKDTIACVQAIGISVALNGIGTEPDLLRHVPLHRPNSVSIGKACTYDSVVLPYLIDTCRTFNVEIVARSVETREQLSKLQTLGVNQFQGALFEPPIRAVDFVSRWGSMPTMGRSKIAGLQAGLRLAG